MMERDLEVSRHLAEYFVVRDDRHDIAAQLAEALAKKKIVKTMRGLRDEDGDTLPSIVDREVPTEVIALREDLELASHGGVVELEFREIPYQAHEESAALGLGMLIGVEDVTVVSE